MDYDKVLHQSNLLHLQILFFFLIFLYKFFEITEIGEII